MSPRPHLKSEEPHYYGAPAMFQLNRLHSEGAQHLLELMYHLLCVHTATPLGELLTRIDAQTSVAFAEACQILVTGFQQSESD